MPGMNLRYMLSAAIALSLACGYAYGAQTSPKEDNEKNCYLNRQRLGFRISAIAGLKKLESKQPSNEELVAIFKEMAAKIPAFIEACGMPGYKEEEAELKIYQDFHDQHPCAKLFAMELTLNLSNLANFKKACDDILLEKDVSLAILKFLGEAKKRFHDIFAEGKNRAAINSPKQDASTSDISKDKEKRTMTIEQSLIIEDISNAIWFTNTADEILKQGLKEKVHSIIDNGYLKEKAGSPAYRLGQLIKGNLDNLSVVGQELNDVLQSADPIKEFEIYLVKKNV
jgi:hypothetical protein